MGRVKKNWEAFFSFLFELWIGIRFFSRELSQRSARLNYGKLNGLITRPETARNSKSGGQMITSFKMKYRWASPDLEAASESMATNWTSKATRKKKVRSQVVIEVVSPSPAEKPQAMKRESSSLSTNHPRERVRRCWRAGAISCWKEKTKWMIRSMPFWGWRKMSLHFLL